MAEKKEETKEQEVEQVKEDKTPEFQAQQPDLIGKANSVAERLEKGNKLFSALLDRQEKLQVEKTLGGSTEAGIAPKVTTDEDKAIAAAKKQLEGTGYEDMLDPPKQ